MIKEAIEKILSIAENKTYEINGDTYSDRKLVRVEQHVARPDKLTVNSLDGIVKLVKTELEDLVTPVFIRVSSPRLVEVFSALDDFFGRDYPYEAACDGSVFKEGFRDQQAAIIELRSRFIQNDGSNYIIDLISRMTKEDAVTSDDNGVTQTVTARQGVSLKNFVNVKPRVSLIPFRTFREIEQPESEFLLRVDEDGRIGLFEADGGVWQLVAKDNIALYLEAELSEEIDAGKVVVIR